MKAILFVVSLVVAESLAANWSTVWSNYKKERPVDTTKVTVSFFVRSFGNVNINDMTYDVQLTYREKWQDPRLAYDTPIGVNPNSTYETVSKDLVWAPDTFFSNEVSGHDFKLMSENSLVRVFPDGGVLMSRRIQLKLSCPMNLKAFPFDSQLCSIKLASYGHTTQQIVYHWHDSAVQVKTGLSLADFTMTDHNTDYCTAQTNTGEYSCLIANFRLDRSWSRYVYQIFVPVLMLVVIAYLTAWIQDGAARAVLLSVVFAVTLVGYCSLSFILPRTSYAKAVDNFLLISVIFIFGAVVRFAIEWSRRRTFEKDDSLNARDILRSIWYPIAYALIVMTCISIDLS